jgi:hypothetical protein
MVSLFLLRTCGLCTRQNKITALVYICVGRELSKCDFVLLVKGYFI